MPYILNTKKDIKEMLGAIGVNSIEDLYVVLPDRIKLKNSLDLPPGRSEDEVRGILKNLSAKNTPIDEYNSFLGAGCYDHYIPAAIKAILSTSEFTTAYTPYQAESSQGILHAIYEYQSYICLLTGMDVSNASVFDGASSLAESVLMSARVTKRKKIIIAGTIHPEYKKTLATYLSGLDFCIQEAGFSQDGFIDLDRLKKLADKDTACFAFSSPNFFGLIEDADLFSSLLKENGILMVLAANPLSLAMFREPAGFGADIVCGDGHVLGGNLSLGGSSFGFLAAKSEYLRQMPGRIVGRTEDCQGNPAYCLTLQTREQHIRRDKATSNICSNQSLNAIGAAVYLSLMGREGLREVSLYSFNLAQYLYKRLGEIDKVKLSFPPMFFNEFVWEVEGAKDLIDKLYKKKIIAGFYLGEDYPRLKNGILSCCTEKKTQEDIDKFIIEIKENM